jgi:inorganic pyrophosphatase
VANLLRLPTYAKDKNDSVYVVVECPRGSGVKLKYEPRIEAMTFGRTLPYGLVYPFDFGFVPSTRADDGDPLDAMILCDAPTAPGVVVACHPIGVIQASQRASDEKAKRAARVRNDRVLFIADGDHRSKHLSEVATLPPTMRDELCTFFSAAVALENKELEIIGWANARTARATIERARTRR